MNNVSPLDVSGWVTRLQAQCPALKFVGRAADNIAAIDQGPKVNPSAYVLEPKYTPIGTPNASSGAMIQMVLFEVPVLVCCQNYGDTIGGQAAADNYTARAQVWAALVGWPPAGEFAVSVGTGQLIQYKNQILYYMDTYKLQVQLRNYT